MSDRIVTRGPVDVMHEVALIERLGLAVHRPSVTRPLPPLDEAAFDAARDVFHREYRRYSPQDDAEHQEAVDEALHAFLGTYEEVRQS